MNDAQSIQTSDLPDLEALILRYREAEAALESLFNGQIDTILDPVSALPILLKHTQEHLRVSEARYRRLIARNAMVVFELEADGTILFASDNVRNVFGYTAQELHGQNWWTLLLPEDQQQQMDSLYTQFQQGDVSQHELTMITRAGNTVIIELNSANRRKPDGSLDHILGLAIDITERRKAEEELSQNRARLEQLDDERIAELSKANLTLQHLADLRQRLLEIEQAARIRAENADKMKVQFLAMVTHELRTPLTSIKGFATTLLANEADVDAQTRHDFVTIIVEEADKLNDLIGHLTDLGRLQAGTLRVELVSCRLTTILGIAMAQLEAVAGQHRLITDIAPDLPMVMADTARIAGVLVNLVGNASRYAPLQTSITLAAFQNGAHIQVDVSDEGPGIPVEARTRIFDTFWQADTLTSTHLQGSGLGLAICRGIITAHGGNIWVGEKATGTKMSFTLPIAPFTTQE